MSIRISSSFFATSAFVNIFTESLRDGTKELPSMVMIQFREARFIRGARALAGPLTLEVSEGQHVTAIAQSAAGAEATALLAAGIVKASAGSITIGEYDPRVQPVHCKRLVGYVPNDPMTIDDDDLSRYIAYRAALWGIDTSLAQERSRELLGRLRGVHPAFAFPIVGALLASPRALVLDRPQPVYAQAIIAALDGIALFTTHLSIDDAKAFA